MNDTLDKYKEYGTIFEKYLRPNTFPIAIKLIKNESEIPSNAKRPKKDLKVQNFICQNFSMVRRYGWTIAITEKDCACKLARAVYGWDPISEAIEEWGHKFNIGLYAKDLETSKKLSDHLSVFKNEYIGLIISPLTRTKIIPDVVQIYCMPAQAMRLTQAYLYIEGGMLEFKDAGRMGSCHLGVIKTFQTDKPQFVILGNGDRVWGGAEDHEVMYSIPRSKLRMIIEGLEATHDAGLRYPIPKYMNYVPGFQSNFQKKAFKRAGGTLVKDNKQ
ncbi:MAG: hypothetical protein EU539_01930 [Promethearchaeota archaeon]|nr:MAG: hypothetical protein EU539_01930 [Candidatus Lokiarchaeota archaeon]